jgi:hypothetical protein
MATAETWVMPLPIVPAPMIPIVRTGMGPSLLLGSDNHVSDRRSKNAAGPWGTDRPQQTREGGIVPGVRTSLCYTAARPTPSEVG